MIEWRDDKHWSWQPAAPTGFLFAVSSVRVELAQVEEELAVVFSELDWCPTQIGPNGQVVL